MVSIRNQVDGLSAKEFKSMVECCLYRLERIKWLQEVEEKEKLVLYKHKIEFCWRSLCAKCKIFISKCVSTITRRNFATDARVRKVQKTVQYAAVKLRMKFISFLDAQHW